MQILLSLSVEIIKSNDSVEMLRKRLRNIIEEIIANWMLYAQELIQNKNFTTPENCTAHMNPCTLQYM